MPVRLQSTDSTLQVLSLEERKEGTPLSSFFVSSFFLFLFFFFSSYDHTVQMLARVVGFALNRAGQVPGTKEQEDERLKKLNSHEHEHEHAHAIAIEYT